MESRVCIKCQIDKPLEAFAWKNRKRNKLNGRCKVCANELTRRHYSRNIEYYRERNKRRTADNTARLRKIKSQPCADCGKSYPYFVMDFDHIGTDKKANVAELVHNNTWPIISRELTKCELVCANCHRFRTHGYRGSINRSLA